MSSSDVRHTLLVETHRAIDAAVDDALAMLESRGVEPVYPPGVELSEAEVGALASLSLSADLRSALQKIIRDAASRPLFQLLSVKASPTHTPRPSFPSLSRPLMVEFRSASQAGLETSPQWSARSP